MSEFWHGLVQPKRDLTHFINNRIDHKSILEKYIAQFTVRKPCRSDLLIFSFFIFRV